MKHFEKIIENLKTDRHYAIKVVDLNTQKNIVCNANGDFLAEKYGSVEYFFENIFKSGVQKIQITNRRKNGSTFITVGDPYDFDMVSNEAIPATQPVEATPFQPNFSAAQPTFPSLNGGMNAVDIYKYMDHPRLELLCQNLTSENKILLEKVASLEKINLKNELLEGKTVASANANTELLKSFGPLLAPVLEKFLTPSTAASAVGLGVSDFSMVKKEMVEIIKNTDDDVVYYLGILSKNIDTGTIANDIIELLDKHNLIPKSA